MTAFLQSKSSANQSLAELAAATRSMESALARLTALVARPERGLLDEVVSLTEALRNNADNQVTQATADGFFLAAHFCYLIGASPKGIVFATDAVTFAHGVSDPATVRKALTCLGTLRADTGDLAGAIECFSEALELATALHDRRAQCLLWANLGGALMCIAQNKDAVTLLDRAVLLSGPAQDFKEWRDIAVSNLILAHRLLGDYARGLRLAEEAIVTADEPLDAPAVLRRVTLECQYSRLLLDAGAPNAAKDRLLIAKNYASRRSVARIEILVQMTEGILEVHSGHKDVGLSRLYKALDRSRENQLYIAEALTTVVNAHEMVAEPDLALVYLRELIRHNQRVQIDAAALHHMLHVNSLKPASDLSTEHSAFHDHELTLRGKLAEQVAKVELTRTRVELLERLAITAELRDDPSGKHTYRVGRLASLLAREQGCNEEMCQMIELAARLHDIGKMSIPDAIVLKRTRLSDDERCLMQSHTTIGAELLSKTNVPHLQMAEEIARFHHEWWDGSGYPFGIESSAIPVSARIVALCDVFDAITHTRSYKAACSVDGALEQIAAMKGRQFEPELTELFVRMMTKLKAENMDIDAYLSEPAKDSPFFRARHRIAEVLRLEQIKSGFSFENGSVKSP